MVSHGFPRSRGNDGTRTSYGVCTSGPNKCGIGTSNTPIHTSQPNKCGIGTSNTPIHTSQPNKCGNGTSNTPTHTSQPNKCGNETSNTPTRTSQPNKCGAGGAEPLHTHRSELGEPAVRVLVRLVELGCRASPTPRTSLRPAARRPRPPGRSWRPRRPPGRPPAQTHEKWGCLPCPSTTGRPCSEPPHCLHDRESPTSAAGIPRTLPTAARSSSAASRGSSEPRPHRTSTRRLDRRAVT